MKELYEKPTMQTESVDIGSLIAGSGGGSDPILGDFIGILNPLFKLCCN